MSSRLVSRCLTRAEGHPYTDPRPAQATRHGVRDSRPDWIDWLLEAQPNDFAFLLRIKLVPASEAREDGVRRASSKRLLGSLLLAA